MRLNIIMQTIKVKQFITALQRVSAAIPNNNVLPITECVYIKDNVMTATNTNLSIQAKVEFEGLTILPHKLLLGLLNTIETETANIYEQDNNIYILSGETEKHKLSKAQDEKHFPKPLTPAETNTFEVGETFFTYLANAIKCHSDNETFKTHGALISEYITGSDNTVIYTVKTPWQCLLHVSPLFVKACAGMTSATIEYNSNFVSADDGNIKVMCKLMDSPYVDIRPVVAIGGTAEYNLKINRDALLHRFNTIEVYGHPVRVCHLFISPNKIHLHYYNIDFEQGSDFYLDCQTSIEQMEVHVSVPEIIKILSVQPEGMINMRFAGTQAIIIQPETNKNILSFLMPCL